MSVAPTTKYITVAAATGTVTINATNLFSRYVLETSGTVTLSANLVFSLSGSPFDGQTIQFDLPGTIVLNGFTFSILGTSVTADQALVRGTMYFRWNGGAGSWYQVLSPNLTQNNSIQSNNIKSLETSKLTTGVGAGRLARSNSSGEVVWFDAAGFDYMPIGNGTDVVSLPSDAAGDVLPSIVGSAIRWLIGAGKIVNAHISAAAAIARTKLASGTASHVLINDGSGVMSSEAQLAVSRGGTGLNNSAATGLQKYAAGLPSVGLLVASDVTVNTLVPSVVSQAVRTQRVVREVLFTAAGVGDFKMKMPKCNVVELYAFLDVAIGAAAASITPKNNAGTTMTDGVLNFASADPKGTAVTATPTANNVFADGDIMTLTTAGGNNAGIAAVTVTYELID